MFTIDHLTFRYPGHVVFEAYSAQIPRNALIYGPNGCGKTTLLQLLAKILVPKDGTILWNQSDRYRASVALNRTLLYDDIVFEKQLLWICSETGHDKKWLHARCEPLQLASLLPLRPGEMSQGMRQWATLAFVCAMPADVYLLDEPLASLDKSKCIQFLDFIKNRTNLGESFILTGHTLDIVNDAPWLSPFELKTKQQIA